MSFTHPLARNAKVWPTSGVYGQSRRLLVIVTTLDLDPESKKHKTEKVGRLSDAAKEWLSFNQNEADDFIMINRAKDW